ncbi:unnamed protein product [Protopolystoma xenopodis]|uniref:Uncharacterized protein n=1 Tax=Protopolystoma xenopodis TaxID=117903 RepID=A0A448X9H2_9PLAT|nr:unnamed protein product [Protopolystoma xenopodis]
MWLLTSSDSGFESAGHEELEETSQVLPSGAMTATSNAPLESGTASAIVAFTGQPDPLRQLLQALSRSAMEQASDDPLYLAYARIMSKVSLG